MSRRTPLTVTAFLAFAAGVIVGVYLAPSVTKGPEITINRPTSSLRFVLAIPSEKRAGIANLAEAINQLDLPNLLRTSSQEHADLATAWEKEPWETIAIPAGVNRIHVTTMVPRYASSDPHHEEYVRLAKALNEDVIAKIQAILESRVSNE